MNADGAVNADGAMNADGADDDPVTCGVVSLLGLRRGPPGPGRKGAVGTFGADGCSEFEALSHCFMGEGAGTGRSLGGIATISFLVCAD